MKIYANTKGELWYEISVDESGGSGGLITKTVGEEVFFFWEEPTLTFWVVTSDKISKGDYSKKYNAHSSSDNISNAAAMNPPEQVRAFIKNRSKLK